MQTQAPSTGRVMVAIGFALSCFGILLFLWVTFGGPTPFKAKSYRFTADFPEAVTLAKEADVRIGGVSVGKVKELSLPPDGNATEVTIEVAPKYAPIASNSRAILRQKTLLGETYIELTGGSPDAPPLPDGGHLANSRTVDSTQIDEIFQALDPQTRRAFQSWMHNSGIAVRGRSLDLNGAFGNLGPFTTDATSVLRILNAQQSQLQGLVRDTGQVFDAISARDGELSSAITSSNTTFRAIASRDQALADTVRIFPTFNEETRLTLNRLAKFAHDTEPLVQDLKPVADDLSPTFESLRRLAPNLRHLFVNLGPLLDASQTGLPALRKTLAQLRPVLAALDPFLANLNPIVRYTNYYRSNVGDFLDNPPAGLGGTLQHLAGEPAPRHTLRQVSYLSEESLSVHPSRVETNRGNGYLQPYAINSYSAARGGIFPNFDCNPSGGEIPASAATTQEAPCFVAPDFPSQWGGGRAPQVYADP
jgi:phospholipid/cholesterol/gamma-HCH transport system substrate-binding protein